MSFIYIHGLNSGTNSSTAKALKKASIDVICPKWYGKDSFEKNYLSLKEQVSDYIDEDTVIISSSTGSFYAKHLAEEFGTKVVMFNPVVQKEQLYKFVGKQTDYETQESYNLTKDIVDTYVPCRHNRVPTLIFASTEDEVLDNEYNIVNNTYGKVSKVVEIGGNHRVSLTQQMVDEIVYMSNTFAI